MSGMFALSNRSKSYLVGVDPRLVAVVNRAIEATTVDFGVIEGVRTVERQKEMVMSGASQTMNSKHITGGAVDLMAYLGTRGSWELALYDNIADAMRSAAINLNTGVRWGGAWTVPDIREWQGPMERAMNFYIDTRRRQGRRPFLDAPHFELV